MAGFGWSKTGSAAVILDLGSKAVDAYELYQATQSQDALLNFLQKLAELAAIGVPVWFLDQFLSKTGLDRVFDSLRKNKTLEQYIDDEALKKTIRDATVGEILQDLLRRSQDAVSDSELLDPLFEKIHNPYNRARTPQPRDPLAIDLDGDGLETVAANGYSGAMFDMNSDGIKVATGWVNSDDGILVWDKNSNNMADNGAELFGRNDATTNAAAMAEGLNYLRDLDSNTDGKISNLDTAFADLRVWRDLNGDGTSQTGELLTLDQAGIASLSTAFTTQDINLNNGNRQISAGSYTRTDGSTGATGDLLLQQQTIYSRFTDRVALTDDALALPGLQGMGVKRGSSSGVMLFSYCTLRSGADAHERER